MTLPCVRDCTLFSASARTTQLVSTSGAALGLTIAFERSLPEYYPDRGILLIASDLSPLSIPIRSGVLLLDHEITPAESSGALVGIAGDDREAVTNLANRLSALFVSSPLSKLISITSSAGGLGLTTLVGLLGLVSARANQRTLLIEDSDRLLRIIGARGGSIDHALQPIPPSRVGILTSDVIVTPALLLDARTRFDSVIIGVRSSASPLDNTTLSLLMTANTALAVERSAALLTCANSRSMRILLRQTPYGSLSSEQAASALRSRDIVEWPEDSNLSLAADLGELQKAKRATELARRLWTDLTGGSVGR